MKILLVEDDAPLTELMVLYTRKYQTEWVIVNSEHEAIHEMENHKFSAIILDYRLLDGSSEKVLRASLRLQPESQVLVFSGFLSTLMIDTLSDIRYVSFIRKPTNLNQSFLKFLMNLLKVPCKP